MKHIGLTLLIALIFNQASFAEESYMQKCGDGSNGQKCGGPIVESKIDCSLKINGMKPECKDHIKPPIDSCGLDGKLCTPTSENKCPLSQDNWNAKCTKDSGIRCIKAPCPQARVMVDSQFCEKTASLCGGDGLHKPHKRECAIKPGADSASCRGVIYIRQDKINSRHALDSATAVLIHKDVKTLGEDPRNIGDKPMDVTQPGPSPDGSSTEK